MIRQEKRERKEHWETHRYIDIQICKLKKADRQADRLAIIPKEKVGMHISGPMNSDDPDWLNTVCVAGAQCSSYPTPPVRRLPSAPGVVAPSKSGSVLPCVQ